jgi:hypothetical protein
MMTKINPVTLNGHADEHERQIERLALEVANLQAENRTLRRRLPESTVDMRRLRQAHRDAKAMLLHRFNGYSISRANCLVLGISERRWVPARALLQTARIHNGLDITETDFDVALTALDQTFAGMERAGTAERLKMRLPPSRSWQKR